MKNTIKTYKPVELANMFLLHANTIRFYESMGFISKAGRAPNGYRQYTPKHILQLKIVRNIFKYPFTNHQIRKSGNRIIKKVVEGDLIEGRQYAIDYIECINKEIEKAESTVNLLHNWAQQKQVETIDQSQTYTRKQMAALLGTTVEAVRNWERNDLITTKRRERNNEVLFEAKDLERMKIIYMLRQTGYSMSAIHRCLVMYDKGRSDTCVLGLNTSEQEELLSAGDAWNEQLKKVKQGAQEIPLLIDEMGQLSD